MATQGEMKMKNKFIVLLMGKSGSGKTTIADVLNKKYGWTSIQSYTTRSPRYPNETGHIFVTDEEFDALGEMVAYTEFAGARYCATTQQVEENQVYVIDPDGYEYFMKAYNGKKLVIPIGILCEEEKLFERMIARGDSFANASARIEHDKKKFSKMDDISACFIDSNSYTREENADLIHWIVSKSIVNNNL